MGGERSTGGSWIMGGRGWVYVGAYKKGPAGAAAVVPPVM